MLPGDAIIFSRYRRPAVSTGLRERRLTPRMGATNDVPDDPSCRAMTMRLILNGKAAEEPSLREAVEAERARGNDLEVRVTWEQGDAARYATEAVMDGARIIIAGGGDGTLNEVVQGVLTSEAAFDGSIGVIPRGTANDFASAMGIPEDPAAALAVATRGRSMPIDVGQAGSRFFINMALAGRGTDIGADTPEVLKKAFGRLSYLMAGITHAGEIQATEASIRAPEFDWTGACLLIAVANSRQVGGVQLFPDADVDDGFLDIAILPAERTPNRISLLADYVTGGVATSLDSALVRHRAPTLTLTSSASFDVSLDGEPVRVSEIEFKLRERCLGFQLPP
jgi:lipid kinase YegS